MVPVGLMLGTIGGVAVRADGCDKFAKSILGTENLAEVMVPVLTMVGGGGACFAGGAVG